MNKPLRLLYQQRQIVVLTEILQTVEYENRVDAVFLDVFRYGIPEIPQIDQMDPGIMRQQKGN